MRILLLTVAVALAVTAGASANDPSNTTTVAKPYFAPAGVDPRNCDMFAAAGAAKGEKCAAFAASMIAWKTLGAALGTVGPFAPTCTQTTTTLKFRCTIYNSNGAVIAVSWTPVTYVPKVVTGRLAVQWIAATKARITAARAEASA